MSSFRAAFARSLHKDYVYAVQEGGDVRDWYQELVKSVKPPEQETWKYQLDHMQALLTAHKFKNTVVNEWARDVKLSLRKCRKRGIQRYAIEWQTMAEVVNVIETRFPIFAQIIQGDIQKGFVTTVNEILERLVKSVPNQPIAKVAAATNFRLDHQTPAPPVPPATAQNSAGSTRPPRERPACNFCGRKHQIKDPANHWKSCFMVLPHTCPANLSSLLLSEGIKERTRKAIAAAPKAVQDAIAVAQKNEEAPPTSFVASIRAKDVAAALESVPDAPAAAQKTQTVVAASLPSSHSEDDSVMLDSGAQNHIFNDRFWFRTLNPGKWEILGLFDKPVEANGSGEVLLELDNGNQLLLKSAMFCPDSAQNVVSEDTLKKKGIYWNTEEDVVYHRWKNQAVEVFRINRVNRQPLIPVKKLARVAFVTSTRHRANSKIAPRK